MESNQTPLYTTVDLYIFCNRSGLIYMQRGICKVNTAMNLFLFLAKLLWLCPTRAWGLLFQGHIVTPQLLSENKTEILPKVWHNIWICPGQSCTAVGWFLFPCNKNTIISILFWPNHLSYFFSSETLFKKKNNKNHIAFPAADNTLK